MTVAIFKRDGVVTESVNLTDNSYLNRALMGEDTAFVEFLSADARDLKPGDYTTLLGHTYFIKEAVLPINDVSRLLYRITLYGSQYELEKAVYFISDSTGTDQTADTVYNCTPLELLTQMVVNLNRIQPGVIWQVGNCLTAEAKDVTLSNNNCLEVLQQAAELWETDYQVDGLIIHLRKTPVSIAPLELAVGINSGLRSITANKSGDSDIITRLYAYGSNLNNSTGQKLSIPPVDAPGALEIIEGIKEFEDIYPQVKRAITAIVLMGSDDLIQTAPLGFQIGDYLLSGSPMITFLTGELKGMEFEFGWQYDYLFLVTPYELSPGVTVPGSTGYNFAVGDEFVIWNIEMPPAFVEAAELALYNAAVEYLETESVQKLKLNLVTDDKYFKTYGTALGLGLTLNITCSTIPSMTAGIDVNVMSYKQYINEPHRYDSLVVGDVYYSKPYSKVVKQVINNITNLKMVVVGGGDSGYRHQQVSPAAEWLVIHNLNKYPAVTVTGNSGTEMVGVVTFLSPTRLKINFTLPVNGYAECN